MNEDIIKMARECGLHIGGPPLEPGLERFAALVRAAEREACAKRLEDIAAQIPDHLRTGFVYKTVELCVEAIRERSKE